jgi:hypothetical protein
MVNVGHLALVRYQLSKAFAGEELAKCAKLPFESAFHGLISRILITRADLPPVVNKPVLLDLDKLGPLVVQEPALRNRKRGLNSKVHFSRAG